MVQVGQTTDPRELETWRLTLEALGIRHVIRLDETGMGWEIGVVEPDAAAAREALRQAAEDERAEAPRRERARARAELERTEAATLRLSWMPGAITAAALAVMARVAGLGAVNGDDRWFSAGANVLALTRSAEPWRAVTALTLHADLAHLLLNALAAMFLLPLACEFWGTGAGLWLTLLAGALGNLAEAVLGGPTISVGASTALFAALGVAGGTRLLRRGTSAAEAFRAIVAVLVMFAMFGLGGEVRDPLQMMFPGTASHSHVDVLAHVLGLVFGFLLGGGARLVIHRRPGPGMQWLLGCAAAALIAACWGSAFLATHG